MLKFRSTKAKPVSIYSDQELKDWKDAWPEAERLALRLDTVRNQLVDLKEGTWAHNHWTTIEQVLLRKWKLTVQLQQSGLRQRGPIQKPAIDYSWWEKSDEHSSQSPFWNYLVDKVSSGPDLDRAWEMARDEKLQKARQGLA